MNVADQKKIKATGVPGINIVGKQSIQVIVGTNMQFVADEIAKICKKGLTKPLENEFKRFFCPKSITEAVRAPNSFLKDINFYLSFLAFLCKFR